MSPESESVVESAPIVVPIVTFSFTDKEDKEMFVGVELATLDINVKKLPKFEIYVLRELSKLLLLIVVDLP